MSPDFYIAAAIVVMVAVPAAFIVSDRLRRRAVDRFAVEVVRLKTGWLADAARYLSGVARGRGRGHGLHVLPAGEAPERPAWLPLIDPPGSENWTPSQWNQYDLGIEPLEPTAIVVENYDDPLREHIDAAWAYTGTTEAGYWADTRTANQRALLWKAREVMPERVIAALQAGSPERTVIDSDLTPETRTALVEEFAGGDPYSGEGEAWFDAFDRIEARMHERIAKARAELDQLFAGAAA